MQASNKLIVININNVPSTKNNADKTSSANETSAESLEEPLLVPDVLTAFPEYDPDEQTPKDILAARKEREATKENIKWGIKQMAKAAAFNGFVDAGGAFMWEISDYYLVGQLSENSLMRWAADGAFQVIGNTAFKMIPSVCYDMCQGKKFREALKESIKLAEIATSFVSGALWLPFRNLGEVINNKFISGDTYSLGKIAVRTGTIIAGIGATLFGARKIENKLDGRKESHLDTLANIAPGAVSAGAFNVQGDTDQNFWILPVSNEGEREPVDAAVYVGFSNIVTGSGIGFWGLFSQKCPKKSESEKEVTFVDVPTPV